MSNRNSLFLPNMLNLMFASEMMWSCSFLELSPWLLCLLARQWFWLLHKWKGNKMGQRKLIGLSRYLAEILQPWAWHSLDNHYTHLALGGTKEGLDPVSQTLYICRTVCSQRKLIKICLPLQSLLIPFWIQPTCTQMPEIKVLLIYYSFMS